MELNEAQRQFMNEISSLALSLGISKAAYPEGERILSHIPLSYFPYQLSRLTFDKIKRAHLVWQKLFVNLAGNVEFVTKLGEEFSNGDQYMGRLLQIYKKIGNPKIGIACTRVDYMGDENPQLVQANLMSVGLNTMADRVQTLQGIVNTFKEPYGKYTYPVNENQKTLCESLVKALEEAKLTSGLVLMIVHDKQFNYGDQAGFKLEMLKLGRIVLPVTMEYLLQNLKFVEETNEAYLNNDHIDAFFFRTGYKIEHFPTQQHWKLREQIQKSNAIKLPSIDMIIINTKRMQSQMAKPQVLEKYLNKEQAQLLSSLSGQICDFDNKTPEQITQIIQKTNSQDYVLKPNREGGGNNFFGKETYTKLKELREQNHLQNYILMKKIQCSTHSNYFIIDHKSHFIEKVSSEFSTLGSFVYKGTQIIRNVTGGTLVRLKKAEQNEGGIAINKGAISGLVVINFQ